WQHLGRQRLDIRSGLGHPSPHEIEITSDTAIVPTQQIVDATVFDGCEQPHRRFAVRKLLQNVNKADLGLRSRAFSGISAAAEFTGRLRITPDLRMFAPCPLVT